MSLRTRLITVFAILAVTYVVTAFLVVSAQRSLLIGQIDRQLQALPPPVQAQINAPGSVTGNSPRQSGGNDVLESGYSAIYIGMVNAADEPSTVFAGTLLEGIPNINQAVAETGGGRGLATIRGDDGTVRYRALVTPQLDGASWIVSAVSLNEADAALARLVRTLWIAGGVIALVLAIAAIWVYRLGLRPIARVTAAAEAITADDRAHRVEVRNESTEAGKLGRAFNVMLDERDLTEGRLRQFIADASHELRSPLTSIRGYLELYRQGAFREQPQLDDVVRRMSAESTRMNGLVEDLLALTSLDEGRPLQRDEVDLGEIVRDAAQDASVVQPARTISVEAPDSGPIVTGDRALLIQLAGILVSNALAHTPETAAVTLSAAADATGAMLVVADRGPGLDADAVARAFDRFWRNTASRTRNNRAGGGAGLGLAIARSIAEAHGGTITLESVPGSGSTFTVRLPKT